MFEISVFTIGGSNTAASVKVITSEKQFNWVTVCSFRILAAQPYKVEPLAPHHLGRVVRREQRSSVAIDRDQTKNKSAQFALSVLLKHFYRDRTKVARSRMD